MVDDVCRPELAAESRRRRRASRSRVPASIGAQPKEQEHDTEGRRALGGGAPSGIAGGRASPSQEQPLKRG